MKRSVSIAVLGAMIATFLGLGVTPAAAAYESELPKMPATTAIIVLDLAKDKSEDSWAATEALLAITTIQGIVNRTSGTKIYLTNSPQKWTGVLNPPNVDQFALDDGLVPVTHASPTLDNTKRFPVLSYLAANYGSFLNGKIMYPSLSQTVNDSAVMAAVTAAAQENAVPLSSTIETYLAGEGRTYTQIHDTRTFSTELDAFNWAKANYLQADTTRQFVAKHGFRYWGGGPELVPMAFDYFVASKAFIYSLDANVPAQRAAISSLLNTTNYPAGTPVLGEINGELSELDEIETCGYYFVFLDGANYSVHSSFSSEPTQITAPAAPTAAPIASNGAYVAFYVTDGDNVSIAHYNHHNWWRNSPYKGEVPIGWSLPPILLDIYPEKMQWFSTHNYDNAYEIVANANDGTAPNTAAGEAAFTSSYRYYLDNSNGLFRSVNYFDTSTAGNAVIAGLDPDFAIRGYQGAQNGNSVTWTSVSGIPNTTMSGSTQNTATPQEIANAAKYVVDNTPAGTPAFVVVAIGDGGHSGDPAADAAAAMALLLADPDGRDYEFLRPVDLGATWESYQTSPTGTEREAESGTLTGAASVFSNGSASGGQIVGSFYQGAGISFASIPSSGTVQVRYANGSSVQGKVSLYSGGTDVAQVTLPPTGSWDTFSTVTVTASVSGTVKLQIDADDGAAMGGAFITAGNIDKVSFSGIGGSGTTAFEAESGALAEGPSVYGNSNASGGQIVGGFYQGGSMTYTGAATGTNLAIRYSNGSSVQGKVSLYVNGVDVAQVTLAPTGSWDTFATVNVSASVSGTIKLQIDPADGSAMGGAFITAGNIDRLVIS